MATPTALLTDVGPHLTAAQALMECAADQLGPPTEEPLRLLAADLEHLRRRIRNATTTATTGDPR